MKIFGKELKLLILDVDGVLLDLMACFEENLSNAATEMNLDTVPITQYVKNLKSGNQNAFSNTHDSIRWLWPHLNAEEVENCFEKFKNQEKLNPYPPIPGSLVATLFFQRHMRVALCTAKEMVILKQHLEQAEFEMSWFSYISSLETGHPKPDPRALTIITDSLNISKENTLFVGDGYPDWECAKKVGIEFVAVLSGGIPKHVFLREGVPEDHIVTDLFDIFINLES